MRLFRFALVLSSILAAQLNAEDKYEILNKSYPPGQSTLSGIESGRINDGIKVELRKNGQPVAAERIIFTITNAPGKGASVAQQEVMTDAKGSAVTSFTIGDKPGDYLVQAFHDGSLKTAPAVIRVKALRQGWIFFLVLGLMGGMALFLFGMDTSSEGLQKAAGAKMRSILGKLTNRPVMGVIVGSLTTAAIQSSTATTMMVIGFVTSTLMTLKQAIGVIFGCNIGTTLTVQLIAFNISDYAPLLIAGGFFTIVLFGSRLAALKFTGQIIFGFGLIFFGMNIMTESMNPLRSVPAFTNLLANIGDNPLLGLLISIIFTGLIHSSGAVIGISIAMGVQGILTLKAAIIISFGANIGTTITALIGGISSGTEGKRVAMVHILFNTLGVLVFMPFITPFTDLINKITSLIDEGNMARSIANAHMIFNMANTLIFLPFINQFEKAVKYIIPEKQGGAEVFSPRFVKGDISSSGIALEQARLEIMRMAGITQNILNLQPELWTAKDSEKHLSLIQKEGEKISILGDAIKKYLREVAKLSLTTKESQEAAYYLHIVENMRHLKGTTETEVIPALRRAASSYGQYTEQQKKDIQFVQTKLGELLKRSIDAFSNKSMSLAEETGLLHKKLKFMLKKLQNQNMVSLLQKTEDESAEIAAYNDLLEIFRAIETDLSQINKTVIENQN